MEKNTKVKNNRNNIKALIAIFILLLLIISIIIYTLLSCKPKPKTPPPPQPQLELEIVGQSQLNGEINLAGQSNSYVAKSEGEVVEDCTWTLTSPISIITFNTNSHTINWADTILDGNYELVLNVQKDGYQTSNFNITLTIDFFELHIIGQSTLQGSHGFVDYSKPYIANDSFNNTIDNCNWTLAPFISGISVDSDTGIITWDGTVLSANNSYFLILTVNKNGYASSTFDIELILYDNYFEWNDSGTTQRKYINMEIQGVDFFSKYSSAFERQFQYYDINPSTSLPDLTSFDNDPNNITKVTKINFKLPEVIDVNMFNLTQGFMSDFCYKMSNLTECNIIMPKIVPDNVGDQFMFRAFSECTNLTKLNDDFIMPTNYTYIESNFLDSIFENSNLEKLPEGFELPRELDANNANFFMNNAFSNCTQLRTINHTFTFPVLNILANNPINNFCNQTFYNCNWLDLSSLPANNSLVFNYLDPLYDHAVYNNFCNQMFTDCYSLTSLPNDFNLPFSIEKVGDYFCSQMFAGTTLGELPDNFNLPQSINDIGEYFCSQMFEGNRLISKLPDNFNLPQFIQNCKNSFCAFMFSECVNLHTLSHEFAIPHINITNSNSHQFCANMFYNCERLNFLPTSFNLTQVQISEPVNNFCKSMFMYCRDLQTIPENFSLPIPNNIGQNFCANMFDGCSSLTQTPNEREFIIPNLLFPTPSGFCQNMFQGTTIPDATPFPGQHIMIARN